MYLFLVLVVVVVVIHHHGFPVLCMYLGNAQYVWYRYSIYLAISDSPRNLPASMHVKGLSVATRLLRLLGLGFHLRDATNRCS